MPKRARTDEQKEARANAILDVAVRRFVDERFDAVTMSAVAREMGLAKGTLYLYFPTKEALFLAALERELDSWTAALYEALDALPAWAGKEEVAHTLAQSLAERPVLTDLLSIQHTVLEQNITEERALAFRTRFAGDLRDTAERIHRHLPTVDLATATNWLVRVHALVVGLKQASNPSPAVAAVLQRPSLAPLRVDFAEELSESIRDLLLGARR